MGIQNKILEDAVVKEVAGFLNSDGGTLLIGINDDKPYDPTGHVRTDYTHGKSNGTLDKLIDHINQYLFSNIYCQYGSLTGCWNVSSLKYKTEEIIRIEISKSPGPVTCYQKRAQRFKKNELQNKKRKDDADNIDTEKLFKFRRQGSSTETPSLDTWEKHIFTNWKK